MAKILYIQASPRGERSKSNQVAAAFLKRYQQSHPDDTITTIHLFEKELPAFDGDTIRAKYSIMHDQPLPDPQRQAWKTVEMLIDEFKDADKYVFSLPMWNFGIPYRLKQYIDILVQPGYTFTVGENGYEGLVKDRRAVLIYARGGAYGQGTGKESLDMQKPYMELILGFIGITDIRSVVVESTLQNNEQETQKVVQNAVKTAESLAETF